MQCSEKCDGKDRSMIYKIQYENILNIIQILNY